MLTRKCVTNLLLVLALALCLCPVTIAAETPGPYSPEVLVQQFESELVNPRFKTSAAQQRATLLVLASIVEPLPEPLRTRMGHFLMAERINLTAARFLAEVSNEELVLCWPLVVLILEHGSHYQNTVSNQMKVFLLRDRARQEQDPATKQVLFEMAFTVAYYTALNDLHDRSARHALDCITQIQAVSSAPILFEIPVDAEANLHTMLELLEGTEPGLHPDPAVAARAQELYASLLAKMQGDSGEEPAESDSTETTLSRDEQIDLLARFRYETRKAVTEGSE